MLELRVALVQLRYVVGQLVELVVLIDVQPKLQRLV